MNVESVSKNKNTITIVAFIVVCIILNIENLASLFHFSVPIFMKTYAVYFPFLFVVIVFTQKKAHNIEIEDQVLWEVKKRETLFSNNAKAFLRYGIVAGVGIIFILSNMYDERSGFSLHNSAVLIGLIIAIVITLVYGYLKKGFRVGFCNLGVLYGYPGKVMLIKWDDIADFELDKDANSIVIYCKKRLTLYKIILKNTEHFTPLETLVKENLTYKNVAKLLTDD